MPNRIIEVEWEDTVVRHGWNAKLVQISNSLIISVGYAEQDDKQGIVMLSGHDASEFSGDQYYCSKFISRSSFRIRLMKLSAFATTVQTKV